MPSTEPSDKLSPLQVKILDACVSGISIFFSGGAGTGKSTLLSHIVTALQKKHSKEEVFVTATTGLAACAIGGITVHQFAGMRPGDSGSTDMVCQWQIIWVDNNECAVIQCNQAVEASQSSRSR